MEDSWLDLEIEPKAYIPQHVSTGPYHRGKARLKEMEKQKWRLLQHVVQRTGRQVKLLLDAMSELEETARQCFAKQFNYIESGEFMEMMLLDACFVLELLNVSVNGLIYCGYSWGPHIHFERSLAINNVTSYLRFTNGLINSSQDVLDKGIIDHELGSEEEVASLFNNLYTDIAFDINDCYLSGNDAFAGCANYFRAYSRQIEEGGIKGHFQEIKYLMEDHISVEIRGSDDTLVSSISEKMEKKSSSVCICRVPDRLRKLNEQAYAPELVSIGPLHRTNKEGLQAMEEQKWHYLYMLLGRKLKLEATLDNCVQAIRELEHRARKCYAEPINLTSDQFVEVMLVDGCFIIELFLKYTTKGLRRKRDPIFHTPRMLFSLRCDMILLENQLPFFVLEHLFNLVPIPKQCGESLTELAFRFFKTIIPGDKQILQEKFNQEGSHLLDLIHNCYLPTYLKVLPKREGRHYGLHCATKLQESGVKFKKAKAASSLLDIKFGKGVLEFPPIKIHHYTDSLLRNLVALEQCYEDFGLHISSYALLIGSLIRSRKDVKLLHGKGILTNSLDNDEEVSALFNMLCKEVKVAVEDFYYEGLCEQVNSYKRANGCEWWAKLKRH
ncbi:hypothetical protein HHK36_012256 [Tetracentron sinense]|uniref:Uncharacterized protein n=1 Tax=Tetracentron sinense TaxID=13715 RepID=A0A834Z878_TETSI|nr:hypothetical protein HHK36_012256 [Tetracentron sinense]